MNTVERVARAIANRNVASGQDLFDGLSQEEKANHLSMAETAIECLMTPTDEIVLAAWDAIPNSVVLQIWDKMMKECLK